MSEKNLGIIGGGQLGSLLSTAAKKLSIKTTVYCDDINAPAQNFCDNFICGKYNDKEKVHEFIQKVDLITYEFENIPTNTLLKISKHKKILECVRSTTFSWGQASLQLMHENHDHTIIVVLLQGRHRHTCGRYNVPSSTW